MIARPAPRPSGPPAETANDRLKASFDRVLWGSLIGATLLHFAVFALWPQMVAPDVSVNDDGGPTMLELPPKLEIPPPPPRLRQPAFPVPSADVPEDATSDETTWEANPPELLPPAGPPSREAGKARDAFVAYTMAPRILNRTEVVRAMERLYPDILRNAGIGGTVRVELYIDEAGEVHATRVVESSGHVRLDEAALEVADVYRFSPALNRDVAVAVWTSLPITFQVR